MRADQGERERGFNVYIAGANEERVKARNAGQCHSKGCPALPPRPRCAHPSSPPDEPLISCFASVTLLWSPRSQEEKLRRVDSAARTRGRRKWSEARRRAQRRALHSRHMSGEHQTRATAPPWHLCKRALSLVTRHLPSPAPRLRSPPWRRGAAS